MESIKSLGYIALGKAIAGESNEEELKKILILADKTAPISSVQTKISDIKIDEIKTEFIKPEVESDTAARNGWLTHITEWYRNLPSWMSNNVVSVKNVSSDSHKKCTGMFTVDSESQTIVFRLQRGIMVSFLALHVRKSLKNKLGKNVRYRKGSKLAGLYTMGKNVGIKSIEYSNKYQTIVVKALYGDTVEIECAIEPYGLQLKEEKKEAIV